MMGSYRTLYSEEYYRKYWDSFMKKVPGDTYINMEADLKLLMRAYDGADIPEEALKVIKSMEAQKVLKYAKDIILKQRDMITKLLSGEASLGMISKSQEIHRIHEIRTRFEFNCLQMADFKRKYNL